MSDRSKTTEDHDVQAGCRYDPSPFISREPEQRFTRRYWYGDACGSGSVAGGLLHLHPHHHADRAGPVLAGIPAVVLP